MNMKLLLAITLLQTVLLSAFCPAPTPSSSKPSSALFGTDPALLCLASMATVGCAYTASRPDLLQQLSQYCFSDPEIAADKRLFEWPQRSYGNTAPPIPVQLASQQQITEQMKIVTETIQNSRQLDEKLAVYQYQRRSRRIKKLLKKTVMPWRKWSTL